LAVAEVLHAASSHQHIERINVAPFIPEVDRYHIGAGPGDTTIIVNLGSMQVGRDSPSVQLKYRSYLEGGNETSLKLHISAADQTYHIRLPILDEKSNTPLIFVLPSGTDLRLVFKIFRDDPEGRESEVLVCGGTALLESNKLLCGARRQSLVREHTVSILDSTTLDIAGTILFTYVTAKPFHLLQSPKYSLAYIRPDGGSPVVLVGHRGKCSF
jgi:hypothetical protein